MNVKTLLSKNYINLKSWKTKRKIIVIESDDWGSIRMNSKESYNRLLKKGVPVDKSYFTINDCLETNQDLWHLQEVLSSVKDINNRNPILTLNAVVANPDFKKIIEVNYSNYFYKNIIASYKDNINDSSKVYEILKNSLINNEFFKPQFHGREHLNVRKYMNNLFNRNEYDLLGSNESCLLGLVKGSQIKSRAFYNSQNYMAAFEALDVKHQIEIEQITIDGLSIFEQLFGFKSKSFVAQSLIFGNHLLPVLSINNIEYIQGAQQFIPLGGGKLKVKNYFTGAKTQFNQVLSRRNASFEPSSNPNLDWADKCLNEIKIAFNWNSPAIINSHRVNFMGAINPNNRENNLKQLKVLLKTILIKWPDVEFLSSDELGAMIKN